MKLRTLTVRFVLSSAVFCTAAHAVSANEASPPAAQAERLRLVENFRAGLQASPARQKLDFVIAPDDVMAGSDLTRVARGGSLTPDARRLQLLEVEKKALVALAASREGEIGDLRLRLQRAESERVPASFIFGLMALLAACLGGMACLWRGRRNRAPAGVAAPSYDAVQADARRALVASRHLAEGPKAAAEGTFERHAVASTASAHGLAAKRTNRLAGNPAHGLATGPANNPMDGPADDSLVEIGEVEFDKLMASGRAYSGFRKGSLPPAKAPRVQPADADLLLDIRQKAGFFLSLGQPDQAVRILERHLLENGESSPAIYLYLLEILHSNGVKPQFRKFREEFNLLFNGKVPEFSAFLDRGKDLESYPHVLAHIMALWPNAKVLRVIESAIYRDPWDDSSLPFELPAFRDLVLLHALAQGNARQEIAVPGIAAVASHAPMVLDLDLSEPESTPALTAGVPSWGADFQNTQPGLAVGSGHSGKQAQPALQPAALPAANLIDFELPPEDSAMARAGPKP